MIYLANRKKNNGEGQKTEGHHHSSFLKFYPSLSFSFASCIAQQISSFESFLVVVVLKQNSEKKQYSRYWHLLVVGKYILLLSVHEHSAIHEERHSYIIRWGESQGNIH
jgi:hypothetical protein